MKKLLFLLVGAIVALAAHAADYYFIHGQITGNSSWESVALTKVGDNYEDTGDLVAGEFGIRITTKLTG